MEDHPSAPTTPEETAAVAAAVVVAAVADAAAVTPTCSLLLHYWNSCCYRSVIEENKNDATAVLAGASHATELAKKKVRQRDTKVDVVATFGQMPPCRGQLHEVLPASPSRLGQARTCSSCVAETSTSLCTPTPQQLALLWC